MRWQNLIVFASLPFAAVSLRAIDAVAAPAHLAMTEGPAAPDFSVLDPYGDWRQVEPYGWVWSPTAVTADWRPYTLGTWADGPHGWTWYPEESWGSITYHYGRWTWDRTARWLWVPGATWSPATVAWRAGGGYLGWAPLPPESELALRAGVIPESSWIFVRATDLQESRLQVAALPLSMTTVAFRRSSQPSPERATANADVPGTRNAPDSGALKADAGPEQLRLKTQIDESFDVRAISADGEAHRCDVPVAPRAPCSLGGLPPGKMTLRVTNTKTNKEINRDIEVSAEGPVQVGEINERVGYAKHFFMSGFVVAALGGCALVSLFVLEQSSGRTFYAVGGTRAKVMLYGGLAALPVAAGLVALGYWSDKQPGLELRTLGVSATAGVAPLDGGGAASLRLAF